MQAKNKFSEITPEVMALSEMCIKNSSIDPALYTKYDVKRGLRDLNGQGVLTGLTEISEVCSTELVDGKRIPVDGKLFYRGYDVEEIVKGFIRDERFGFEEVTYLLLFGKLPTQEELNQFTQLLDYYRTLPTSFVRDIIMKSPSKDIMNAMARSVLTLYSYDENPEDTSIPNVLRQCLQLISLFPILSVYGFQAYGYYHENKSLVIHTPPAGAFYSGKYFIYVKAGQQIYAAGGKASGYGAGASRRARRREQLYLYHACCNLFRNRYLLCHSGGAWFFKRAEARRCQY